MLETEPRPAVMSRAVSVHGTGGWYKYAFACSYYGVVKRLFIYSKGKIIPVTLPSNCIDRGNFTLTLNTPLVLILSWTLTPILNRTLTPNLKPTLNYNIKF